MVKHIVCFGDSNTHGYFPNPDRETFGRYDENERWPRLLQKLLGPEYLIFEEGLTGRTTAFDDPLRESMNGLDTIYSCVMSHEPVDLLIVMLGTNDVKERFGLDADEIASGMERLLRKAASLPGWRDGTPHILLLAPPHICPEFHQDYHQKSAALADRYSAAAGRNRWAFLDTEGVGEFNRIDYMHLTRRGHVRIAEKLAVLVPTLME